MAARERDEDSLALTARRYLKLRRERIGGSIGSIFADPAWDMLLDLFVAKMEGRIITKSSAYLASGVPNATAHRYAVMMRAEGWVRQWPDPIDRRRIYIEIEDQAAKDVGSWLTRAFPTG